MLRYFSYECENGDSFEQLVRDEHRDDPCDCPSCGAPAKRVISPCKISLPSHDPAFSKAYDKWGRDRTKQTKLENKKLGVDS